MPRPERSATHFGQTRTKQAGDMQTTRNSSGKLSDQSGSHWHTQKHPQQRLHDHHRVLLTPLPPQTLSSIRRLCARQLVCACMGHYEWKG
jgi:hypothetical protein